MIYHTVAAALLSVAVAAPANLAAVVRQGLITSPIPADRSCSQSVTRCAGEEDQPNVPYAACCTASQICAKPKTPTADTWGYFCLNKADAGEPLPPTAKGGAATTKGGVATTVPTTTDADATTVADTTTSGTTDDDDDDGDSVCFPAGATVELQDGSVVRMDDVSVGDMVKVGVNQFSRVFMFTHKMADTANKFVTLKTSSGAELSLTAGHYLYANGALVAAKTVKAGDLLTLGSGDATSVISVGSATGAGLYNPQTVNGNIVVNGVMSSTYTTAVEPTFAHAVLAPFRMLQTIGLTFTSLESGGGVLADVAPRGQAAF